MQVTPSSANGTEAPTTIGPDLTVVAPAYNEEESIENFVTEACRELDELGCRYELVCVDDGSTDGTGPKLRQLRQAFPRLAPISLASNAGQTAAMAAGVAVAQGRYIAFIDADLQNDPADIARMYRMMQSARDVDCIVGSRTLRRDNWLRRLSSRIANWVAKKITRVEVRDAGCSVKLCRAELARKLPFFRGAHRFIATLVQLDGGRVLEIGVNHRPRLRGHSKYGSGLGRTFVALRDALGVRWMMDRKIRYSLDSSERTT